MQSLTTPRVGCVLRPQHPPELLPQVARAADVAGLQELWLWEDCFLYGGLAAEAIVLAHSRTLTVGIGVLPVPLRSVAATAMEIATLERTYPGRLRVGVGHGVQDWMAQVGRRVDSPLTLLREYLHCLRALLDGECVTFDGRYIQLDAVQLAFTPADRLPLLVGATGPRTLELSGELADGTILTGGTTPDAVRRARLSIEHGVSRKDRSAPHTIVAYLPCVIGPNATDLMGNELRHWDFSGDSNDLAVFGATAGDVIEQSARWLDAGVDTLVFQPTASADPVSFVRQIAAAVERRKAAGPQTI
ncbi:LLM class flavin-dependent oxidoreductase [Gordonia sp. NPDC003424]